jgi:HEAT repeat protein
MIYRLLAEPDRIDWFRPALPALRETVISDDDTLRRYTIYALRRMDAEGARCLMAALVNREEFHSDTARFIAHYPDVVVPELQKALKAGDPMRRNALQLLSWMAPEGREVVPFLLPLLDENDPETRVMAVRVLGWYGAAARPAVPRLMALTDEDDPTLHSALGTALGNIGIEADQVESLWSGAPGIEEKGTKSSLYYAYGHAAASPGRATVPVLIKGLSHPDAGVRYSASSACAYLGPVAAPAALDLLKTASDTDSKVARQAIRALGNLGSAAAPAADGLLATFEREQFVASRRMDSPPYFEPPAARALANIGPAALPALYKGLASDDIMIQAGCARALGWMDRLEAEGATPHLLKLFDASDSGHVRRITAKALVALGAEPASGTIAVRLDSAYQRERAKRGARGQ